MQSEDKLCVVVLFGGMSSEHEVSRVSAGTFVDNLDRARYEVLTVGITREGRWLCTEATSAQMADGSWEELPGNMPCVISPDRADHGMILFTPSGQVEKLHVDVVIPALHGLWGEDGTVQGLLELAGIPYVGCDTESSAICMDKAVTHSLLSSADIEQAHYLWFYADRFDAAPDTIKNKIQARLDFPVFVKPSNAGSSVGVSKVERFEDLDQAIRKAAREDKKVVVEEGITGQEVEVAVLGNRDCDASIVGEIGASAQFYDYDDKYINGTSQLYIPARIPQEVSEKIRQTAVRAYRLLGCSGLARVDFFVTAGDNRVILNEINTLPGFTSISMYPKLWMAMGLSYGELLDKLIELALQRAGQ